MHKDDERLVDVIDEIDNITNNVIKWICCISDRITGTVDEDSFEIESYELYSNLRIIEKLDYIRGKLDDVVAALRIFAEDLGIDDEEL